jgi:hypothetical protein
MVRQFIILFVLLFSKNAFSEQNCKIQNYDSETAPNFHCPGPGETELVPSLNPPESVPVQDGEQVTAPWDGAVVHRDRLIEMGLKLTAVRRLRWLDRLQLAARYTVETEFNSRLATARIEFYEQRQRETALAAQQLREELKSSSTWYRSLWFGILLGSFITAVIFTVAILSAFYLASNL